MSCSQQNIKFSKERFVKKKYWDTIYYQNKYGFIILSVKVKNQEKKLIFDTGADMIVLGKDSTNKKGESNVRISNGNGQYSHSSFDIINRFEISSLKYTDINVVRFDLPKPLACLSDGIIGNNIIKKSNWKIGSSYLIATDQPLKSSNNNSMDCFYFSSNRLFSNLLINDHRFDTCLIDLGGGFEIDFPNKYYNEFISTLKKKVNTLTERITSSYTINGKLLPDTVIVVNCNIDFCGFLLDSVNIVFSKKTKEKRIGVLLLNKFESIYLDNNLLKMSFEQSKFKQNAFHYPSVSVDLENALFIVDGIVIEKEGHSQIKFNDKLTKINGKDASSFMSYCEFFEWRNSLRKTKTLIITTLDGNIITIEN